MACSTRAGQHRVPAKRDLADRREPADATDPSAKGRTNAVGEVHLLPATASISASGGPGIDLDYRGRVAASLRRASFPLGRT